MQIKASQGVTVDAIGSMPRGMAKLVVGDVAVTVIQIGQGVGVRLDTVAATDKLEVKSLSASSAQVSVHANAAHR